MSVAEQEKPMFVGETRNFSVDFTGKLDSGESLTGTPTVAEQTTSDLTISNEAVSTGALTINGKSVPAGDAVQFTATGVVAGTDYTIHVTCATDSTPAQTVKGIISFSGI